MVLTARKTTTRTHEVNLENQPTEADSQGVQMGVQITLIRISSIISTQVVDATSTIHQI